MKTKGVTHNGVTFSGKTKDKRQTSFTFEQLDRENVKSEGTDKNLLMQWIDEVPKGTLVVQSKFDMQGKPGDK